MSRPISRRRLAAGLLLPALLPLPVRAAGEPPPRWRRRLLGTWVEIELATRRTPDGEAAVNAAFDEMQRLERQMSRFDPGSVLSRLNRSAGRGTVSLPPELSAVLAEARRLRQDTDGAFDIGVGRLTADVDGRVREPDDAERRAALPAIRAARWELDADGGRARLLDPALQLDLGGVAKLTILEAGLALLARRGVDGVLLNGGGDVLVTPRADGRPWRIGIRDAAQPDRLLAVLPLAAGVVASSGDYERFVMRQGRRWHHIIDPATGEPTRGLHGVTLVAERAATVNGLGAAVMVAGWGRAPQLLQRRGAPRTVLMGEGGALSVAPALAAALQPPPGQDHIRG